jgi:hypothetical protein
MPSFFLKKSLNLETMTSPGLQRFIFHLTLSSPDKWQRQDQTLELSSNSSINIAKSLSSSWLASTLNTVMFNDL